MANGVIGTTGDLGAGTFITAGIERAAGGWWRCFVVADLPAAATAFRPQFQIAESDGVTSYTGDGVSGLFIYGPQIENPAKTAPPGLRDPKLAP